MIYIKTSDKEYPGNKEHLNDFVLTVLKIDICTEYGLTLQQTDKRIFLLIVGRCSITGTGFAQQMSSPNSERAIFSSVKFLPSIDLAFAKFARIEGRKRFFNGTWSRRDTLCSPACPWQKLHIYSSLYLKL